MSTFIIKFLYYRENYRGILLFASIFRIKITFSVVFFIIKLCYKGMFFLTQVIKACIGTKYNFMIELL